jgi:hypothetical protein
VLETFTNSGRMDEDAMAAEQTTAARQAVERDSNLRQV